MNEFRIFETEQFQSDLKSNLGPHESRIVAKLRSDIYPQLRRQPFFGRNIKKLKDFHPETWRYRIGMYRFFYEIDDRRKIVFMLAAATRQNSY